MLSLATGLALVAGLYLAYLVYLTIYRLHFHPLAKFPGPKIAAATKYYEFYFDIIKRPGGCYMYEISRMHDIYGPIVRINPDELHVRDSDWVDTLYVGPAAGARDKYPPAALMTGSPLGIFGTFQHEKHRQRRQAISPMFAKRAVSDAESMIYEKAEGLLHFIESQFARFGFAEARTTFLAFTTDVLCAHTFDISLDLLQSFEQALEWKRNIKAVAIITPIAKQFVWLIPIALKLPIWLFHAFIPDLARIITLHRKMHDEADIVIDKHQQGLLKPAKEQTGAVANYDVYRNILFSNLPAEEKERNRIAQEAFTILVAGGETTGRVLNNAVYFILANKETVLQPLMEELMSVMPETTSRPEARVLEQLPWMNAVVKESLRITALVTSRLPLVSPYEPLTYGEWTIPAGTPVGMTLREILLDEQVFEAPAEFRPQRWLKQHNAAVDKLMPYFIPFGRGSRMCIGLNLAMAELYIGIATLFRRMELDLFETSQARDVDICRDCFIGEVSPKSTGIRFKGRRR